MNQDFNLIMITIKIIKFEVTINLIRNFMFVNKEFIIEDFVIKVRQFTQQALKLVNEKAMADGWKEKYTKVKIESTDWGIIKNEYTGVIIKRRIDMQIYGVWPDGKCKMVGFGFEEEYSGGDKYGSLRYTGIGDMTQVICEQ